MNSVLIEYFETLTSLPHNITLQGLAPYLYPNYILFQNGDYWSPLELSSVSEVEKYIGNLLHSKDTLEVFGGYLNVIFWGFVGNNRNSYANLGRALGKVIYTGYVDKVKHLTGVISATKEQLTVVNDCVQKIVKLIEQNKLTEAVIAASQLKGLGFSFATKLLMFIDPVHCAVLDSVIARKMVAIAFSWDGKYLSKRSPNPQLYQSYCNWLIDTIGKIDGVQLCRAVDLERQLFYL